MKRLLFISLFFPFVVQAHPGVGIVKDSKGNIYYTDLQRIWKITNNNKTVVVPNVHTHELYVDKNDNLYGEGGYYDERTNKFYHYLWVYHPTGCVDTVIGMKEQYIHQDFSLARDKSGNEYYLKRFLAPHTDTNHVYQKTPDGNETIFAKGNFKKVNWLHPQDDGSLLYVSENAIYKIDSRGKITLIKDNVANGKPSFKFSSNLMIWGVWKDLTGNIYAAVFSDQKVKKIDANGNITEIYKSKDNWTPLNGVFDNENKLWILEVSDKNDVRVTMAGTTPIATSGTSARLLTFVMISCLLISSIIYFLNFRSLIPNR